MLIKKTKSDVRRLMPERAFRDWPIDDPKILIVTCMKDEGPFILEWVAWHKAIGVLDLVIYTNHTNDGTAEILDRLQEMEEVIHLENPAVAMGSTYFQPIALKAVHSKLEFKTADFVISMDVDEFVNVRCGTGTLRCLFNEVGPFDVLSMSELNHGSNGVERFSPGWVTEQFPKHQTQRPGRWKAERGVKSIVRLSEKVLQIRNHRPDVDETAVWKDGGGRSISTLREDTTKNGIDTRGTYKHVVLEHFPLRSLESYLIKMDRGDVVIKDKMVSRRYWRMRNQNAPVTSDMSQGISRARAYYEEVFKKDAKLMKLQQYANEQHRRRIDAIIDVEPFKSRKQWILENAWR